ncbi:hypothetical protein D3C87_574080 [compost metagenome]
MNKIKYDSYLYIDSPHTNGTDYLRSKSYIADYALVTTLETNKRKIKQKIESWINQQLNHFDFEKIVECSLLLDEEVLDRTILVSDLSYRRCSITLHNDYYRVKFDNFNSRSSRLGYVLDKAKENDIDIFIYFRGQWE